jgi:hypothetical protein
LKTSRKAIIVLASRIAAGDPADGTRNSRAARCQPHPRQRVTLSPAAQFASRVVESEGSSFDRRVWMGLVFG